MGKIKKILENELTGGTQSTEVYPVTSIKAVYDENRSFNRNISNDEFLKLDEKYRILNYISECPDIFDSMTEDEMVEEIERYVS